MLTLNSNILKIGNKWILPVQSGGVVPPEPTVYQVTTSATHGTVTASPTEGISGTEITLSNTPDTHYHFGSYSLTGATLKNANQFDIADSDVSVVGNFIEDTKYLVTCTDDGHGTIAASPTSNYSGSTVTLSNTPNSGYDFDKYTLVSGTGASISGNTLTIGTSNVTVRGDFIVHVPSVTYDSYYLVITPISKTYDVPLSSSNYLKACSKNVAGTTISSISIKNLTRTATAGGIMMDEYTVTNFTSSELSAMASSSGYTSFVTNGRGYSMNLEGGSLSRLSFDINATLASNSYDLAVQLLGRIEGQTALDPLAYTIVPTGQYTSVTLTTDGAKYIDYRFVYVGDDNTADTYKFGAAGMMLNGLSFTPTTAMSYEVYSKSQGICDQSHTLTSSEIASLISTSSSSYYTMPLPGDEYSDGIFALCCISDTLPSSVSFTELGTAVSSYNFSHMGSLYIMSTYISCSSYFIVSEAFPGIKSREQILVNHWPTTLSITV